MASSVIHFASATLSSTCNKISSFVPWAGSASVKCASSAFSVFPFRSRSNISSLTVDKRKNKQLFASARTYLASKFKSAVDDPLQLPPSEEMEDTFEGMQLKWSVGSRLEKYKKWRLFPGRREIPFFKLSFREDYESRVRSKYLPYVAEEAGRINTAKKLKLR